MKKFNAAEIVELNLNETENGTFAFVYEGQKINKYNYIDLAADAIFGDGDGRYDVGPIVICSPSTPAAPTDPTDIVDDGKENTNATS